MSAMEESLRRALRGGDASDPAFRESIYAASERALERMLEGREADDASREEQRERLAETIRRIEQEYLDHEADRGEAPEEAWDDAAVPASEARHDDGRAPRAFEPALADDDVGGDADWTPGGVVPQAPARRRRSSLVLPAVAIAVAVALAILAYLVTGLVRGDAAATGDTASLPGQAATADLGWIDVFDGNDLEALSTPNGGRIETVASAVARVAVRVSAPSGGEGEVMLTVGAGLMRRIAGREVRIELTAGSPNEGLREFGIRCLAEDRSFCDRQRFSTAMSEEAFVFDVAVPAGVTSAGSIAIGPGLNGTPNDVDIYALRIRALG